MRYLGMFYAREPKALIGLLDAPYATMGRHALCARDMAGDGGAMALANGHIDNMEELCAELKISEPHPDDQACRAQVVLAAYRMWGEEYPSKIYGPASTVVIDQDANRLIISRDRVGHAPVYYAARAASVVFSDSFAPVLSAPFVEPVINAAGAAELLAMNPYFSRGQTPFRDVMRLEPGCALTANALGCRVTRYVDAPRAPCNTHALIKRALYELPQGVTALPDAPAGETTRPDAYFPGDAQNDLFSARARAAAHYAGVVRVMTGERELFAPPEPFAPERAAPLIAQALHPDVAQALNLPAYAASAYHAFAAVWSSDAARGQLARALALRWTLPRRLERAYALLGQYALGMYAPCADERLVYALRDAPPDPPPKLAQKEQAIIPPGEGAALLQSALNDPDAPALSLLDPARAARLPDDKQFFLGRVCQWLSFYNATVDLSDCRDIRSI